MTIEDGVKNIKGLPGIIPDCSRDDLPGFFKRQGYMAGVEVGVFEGDYTEVLAKSGLKIYGVDPWLRYKDYGYDGKQKIINQHYEKAKDRIKKYPNVTLIRKTSMEAVEEFEDDSIDFVYIDGNHYFKYVAEDLFEWSRKVRKGGIIAGHDYAYFKHRVIGAGCQVREVVDAFVKAYDIPNFWVLGRRYPKNPDEKKDHFRSYMMFRP